MPALQLLLTQRAIVAAGKDVDARKPFLPHVIELAAKWTLKQVQGDEEGMGLDYSFSHLPQRRHPELVSGSIAPQSVMP